MTYPSQLKTTYYDSLLRKVVSSVWLVNSPGGILLNGLWNAQQSASVGTVGLVVVNQQVYGPAISAGGAGLYNTNRDIAVMQFLFSDGTTAEVTVCIPKASCFLTGGLEVDPAGALAPFIALVVANGYNSNYSPCVSFQKGWRDQIPSF